MVWVGDTENRAVRDILAFYKPIAEDDVIIAPEPPQIDPKDQEISRLRLENEQLKAKLARVKEIVDEF
jgi:hypothetical protein